VRALRQRVDELELAGQAARLPVAIEEKQEPERRPPTDRPSGPGA
jgi:hypothetical protein